MSVREGLYGLPEPALPPKPPSRWRWAYRIFFGFLIVGIMTITVLTMLGGNGPSMKSSIEQFISDSTGLRANIETLNAATLFPVIGMDLENLTLHDSVGTQLASFEHFNFSTGFWAALIGQSSLRSISIKNARLFAGVMTPGALEIAYMGIDVQGKDGPHLVLKGRYDSKNLEAAVGLKGKVNLFGATSFDLRDGAVLALGAGPILLDGVLGTGKLGQRVIEIQSLSTNPKGTPLAGQVELSRGISGFDLDGYLAQGQSRIDYNLTLTGRAGARNITGKLESKNLNLGDVLENQDKGSFIGHYHTIRNFYQAGHAASRASEPFDFTGLNVKIDTKIDALYAGDLLWGSVTGPLQVKDGAMKFGPLAGNIMGGALAGDVVLDATRAPAKLNLDLSILKAGKTALKIALDSSGNHTGELMAGLTGTMGVVTGQESLPVQGFWNGALAKAMILARNENESLPVSCGILSVTVKEGVGKTSTVFLKNDNLTIAGQGQINFADLRMDLKLEPKATSGAVKPVRVAGAVNHPAIRQTGYSLGRNTDAVIEDLLTTGLLESSGAEHHPCRVYIKE